MYAAAAAAEERKNMEKFRDLKYERPDPKKVKELIRSATKRLRAAKSFEEAEEAFMSFNAEEEKIMTVASIAQIRNTMDMSDKFYDGEMKYYNKFIPTVMPLIKKLNKALIDSPFRKEFEEKYGEHMFKDLEQSDKLISPKVILPSIRENMLKTEYSKTAAACSVEFMGEKCNFYGLLKHMQSTDREERKAAFEAWAGLYEQISPKLDEIYGKLVKIRSGIARKLGFDSYIDYVYLSRGRYDYTPADIERFREEVRRYVTPVCAEMYEEQRQRLGVDKLHWYDESLMFPDGNAVPIGTPEELVEKAKEMYEKLSPETGEFFGFMAEHELYDLVTRENKHLGGYCTSLPEYKAPFIFSNFNGTSADVDVLTHEAGHAFECYYASRLLPISSLVFSTSEINEIHSMSMEHLTYPWMDSFFGDKADGYRYSHFTEALKTVPYLVSVDEFQHRVFENPSSGPSDWRRYWKEIEEKYMPWRDYDGNAFLSGGGFWMQKQHIFLYPFYYVDYALAEMGAFSIYRMAVNGEDAWGTYLRLCSMGGKYGYFETLERAGIPNPLKGDTVSEVADFAREQAGVLKARLGG